jgi:hypothetical protein
MIPHTARIPLSDRCTRCLWKTAPRQTRSPDDDKFETINTFDRPTRTPTCRVCRAIEAFGGRLRGGIRTRDGGHATRLGRISGPIKFC